ncbi:hypothetical protein [Methylobacterium sp. NFXW15]|uniref:hypothetical protein n=1 Tax=Methylobacterium sp. NFXW15 TaxID=2819512 RepID=UPI003CECC1F1
MTADEFEDRYRALETLTVQLIRHMMVRDVFSRDQVEDLMGSLTNLAEGDERCTYCAERLVRQVFSKSRTMADIYDEAQVLAEQRARVYGGNPVPVDL